MLVCYVFQGLGDQEDSDHAAEILAYGKTFPAGDGHTYPLITEEVKRTVSRY